jgi:hypothetical protein
MQGTFIKNGFVSTVGSVCRVKRFTIWWRDVATASLDEEEACKEAREWLKQQSKEFYAGFDALVKRWDN